MVISVRFNGREVEVDIRPNETLLDVLRDRLGLRGAVEGCGVGVCGSCTVLVDGHPTSSCLVLATNAEGRSVTTVEGLAEDGQLSEIQRAFVECQAFQCGYCTSGMLMACAALLAEIESPSDAEIRDYLSGNICRCGTYEEVLAAVRLAVSAR